ncbi:MAG: DUF5683 domain-containing protein [Breznakibacter sp.]
MKAVSRISVKTGILLGFLLASVGLQAQTDTLLVPAPGQEVQVIPKQTDEFHSPHKATLYAAVFPGLGQAYNKKYWKIPVVYAALGGVVYGLSFNQKYYTLYKNAYRDFIIRDPANKSYVTIVEKSMKSGLTVEQVETTYATWFQNALKNRRTYYKRNRDLCIIGLAGVYVLSMIDASVDAHFFNYDVSDDLAIKVFPDIQTSRDNLGWQSPTIGLQVNISF